MANPLSWLPKPARRALLWLVVALVVGYLVVPQIAGFRRAADLISNVDPLLVVLGLALQALGIVCQAELTRLVVTAEHRPTLAAMLRIELATMAVSHTVPGGTAAGTALAYRLLQHNAGVPGAEAGFAVGTRGLGSAVVLNVILWFALVVSIPAQGFHPFYTAAAVLGALLLAVLAALVVLVVRHEPLARRAVRWTAEHLPLLDPDAFENAICHLAERLRQLASRPRLLAVAIAWSAGYWLLSAASLWVFIAAFGPTVRPDSLLVAFGLANVLGAIPITPRGLGVIEAVLVPMLVGFGTPRGPALFGVLGWRLASFWLPIPAGGLAYLSLRLVPAAKEEPREARRERVKEELSGLAESAERDTQALRDWARARGLRLPD